MYVYMNKPDNMYVYLHTHTSIHIYTYIQIYTSKHTHMCTHIYIHTYEDYIRREPLSQKSFFVSVGFTFKAFKWIKI